jgi:hypothetical protein
MESRVMKMAESDIKETVAQHQSEIAALGGRMSGVETGLRTLQSEVHTGFAAISTMMHKVDSKIDRFDQRPQFNVHQWIGTLLSLSILFVMIVSGIIYVAQSQFSAVITKQDGINDRLAEKIDELGSRVGWYPSTKRADK